MRWPLRYQVMLPMAAIMLLTVVFVGGLGAALGARWTRTRIDTQIAEVKQIVLETNFPLTDAILCQMRALSGAELVLVSPDRHVIAASERSDATMSRLLSAAFGGLDSMVLGERLSIEDRGYFHTSLDMSGRAGTREESTLHILYPEQEYRRAWLAAVYPSLGFIVLALPVVMFLAMLTASRIGGRVSRLHHQVDRIAQGDFRALPISPRDDEIRSLGQAVNRLASMLIRYEQEVRLAERMRTLARLGGGIAHQLRNSATGCGMALDLHVEECPLGDSCESLTVARRQLRLMEEFLQRFLRLGQPQISAPRARVNLAALVTNILPMISPAARHAGVDVRWTCEDDAAAVIGDEAQLSHLVVNLLLNAIEAATEGKARDGTAGQVVVGISPGAPERLLLTVTDSGPGPAEHVQSKLFEPFVTEKPDGVGLGLAVAKEVVEQHGGSIHWIRFGKMTRFTVDLPRERCKLGIQPDTELCGFRLRA